MLKVMRENIKNLAWVLWAVIAVFVLLVFVDFGGAGLGGPTGAGNVAASVGEHKVTWPELEQQGRELETRMRSLYGDQWTSELAEQLQIKRRALEELLNSKILLAEARRLGLKVSDEELRQEILRQFGDEGGEFLGREIYESWTSRQFGSPAAFEEMLREDLLRRKLVEVLTQTVYVSDEEVESAYREDVERAAIRYLLLPRDRFADEARADQASLERYYQEHQADYGLPEQRAVDYLLVDKGLLRSRLEIPEADLVAYYEENADQFTREDQVQARHILLRTDKRSAEDARTAIEQARRRIEGGEDFAAVARELSEDPGSAARGGDLGSFGRGRMVPAFEEAAFGAEVGEMVGPFESDFGVHLLEVTGRSAGGSTPFEQAREAVRARLASERVDGEAAARALRLRSRLDEVGPGELRATMEQLAEEDPSVQFATAGPFGEGGLIPGVGRSPELSEAAFALGPGELAQGTISAPRGPMVVRLAEVLQPRIQPLAEVEARVRSEVERERQQELAEARLAELRQLGAAAPSLEAAAAELGVDLVETPEFGRGGTIQGLGFAPEVAEVALGAEQGDLVGPLEVGQGALLFEVTERHGFDPEELERRRQEIRAQVAQERTEQLLSSLILERRRQQGGIRLSRELQEEIGAGVPGAS
jgi:peptidyl-prolyl cis-trans isomerase D